MRSALKIEKIAGSSIIISDAGYFKDDKIYIEEKNN